MKDYLLRLNSYLPVTFDIIQYHYQYSTSKTLAKIQVNPEKQIRLNVRKQTFPLTL